MVQFSDMSVAEYYERLPHGIDKALMSVRDLIFTTAADTESVGEIEESLKWGMPSYATVRPASGTPIRLSPGQLLPGRQTIDVCELSVHCQSTLIADFKEVYPDLTYNKNRALLITATEVSMDEVKHFVRMALTYHHRRKQGIRI